MTIEIPDFPTVWDSTMRSALVACPRQLFWAYLKHLRKPGLSIHLHFGGCVATGIELARKAFYRDSCNLDEAVCIGHAAIINSWGGAEFDYDMLRKRRIYKSLPAAHDALEAYIERWPFDNDDIRPYRIEGELMIEKTFALPIPGTAHPRTGEPLIYCGRCDMIGDWKETGTVFIDDEKTSNSLGKNWRGSWRLRGQFTGYVWGCRSFGVNAKGVIIRGMGILSNEINTDEIIEMRGGWLVDQWLRQLARDLNRASSLWTEMVATATGSIPPWRAWDQAFDSACTPYGAGCQFIELCQSEHPERWLSEYEVREWNPLQRGDET